MKKETEVMMRLQTLHYFTTYCVSLYYQQSALQLEPSLPMLPPVYYARQLSIKHHSHMSHGL
eukprot:scaffold191429_cov35-Attheya_sp.AAC.1